MRIVHLTAGTGSFYCGTCIRDNALVRGLRALGHDAELVPLYLPIVSEGPSCSAGEPILMGGINVYLQQSSAFFRALPPWLDAPLSARPLLSLAGRFAGRTRPEDVGALTLDMLRGAHGGVVKEIERLVRALRERPPADVIVLSNSLLVGLAAPLQAELGVPVVCTVQGEAYFVRSMGEPWTSEAWPLLREGLEGCAARLAVSRFAADDLAGATGMAPEAFDVVHNGIDVGGYLEPVASVPPVIGFFARMYRAKGLELLARAFVRLREEGRSVRLRLGGTLNAGDEADLRAVMGLLAEAGVAEHVEVRANLSPDDKRAFLSDLTVFCVPAIKPETFGQYNLEALEAGVPVVAPRQGALPEVLEPTGGVLWCRHDDVEDTARALGALLDDAALRARLARAGRQRVEELYTEERMAEAEARALAARIGRAAASRAS